MTYSGESPYNADVETIRDEEYPMLKDSIYLDHAGTTPYPKSLMGEFARDMTANLFGNPHSASPSSQLSTARIDDTRLRVLDWFNADPREFDVIFVANATAGVKLVVEALRASPGRDGVPASGGGFDYLYHQACHTSLVGVREEARRSASFVDGPQSAPPTLAGSASGSGPPPAVTLVAYPAQSNLDGRRFPLAWSSDFRTRWATPAGGKLYTLLDAAALAATAPLDLGDAAAAPDFTVLSFYKIFGFPDLGALIVRRQAEGAFESRRYFGGGTVDMVVCGRERWHAAKRGFLHERLEDGTLPVHGIVALARAMEVHWRLFGGMERVARHTGFLARRLDDGLRGLRHGNGSVVCVVYGRDEKSANGDGGLGFGPVVAFNVRTSTGAWVSLTEFEKLATLKGFHLRTGGVCNPGGIATALGLEPWEMKSNFSAGFRCGSENDIVGGKPTGVIRASLGAMSTISDVDQFLAFVDEFYREEDIRAAGSVETGTLTPPQICSNLEVRSITVYPIKSCGGYQVSDDMEWEVRPEGLAWDREWCLLHRGTGQALNQKQYPKMVLLRPTLDFDAGVLRVTYGGDMPSRSPRSISIPLSHNPALFGPPPAVAKGLLIPSRVCGDEIFAQTYSSSEISSFFSSILGVSCVLARFPPGGQGRSMRHSKARLQKHQMQHRPKKHAIVPGTSLLLPGSFPASPPSPPDSESDSENCRRRILLSNESPLLLVNTTSLEALNGDVPPGVEIPAAVFRANILVGPRTSRNPTEEHQKQAQEKQQQHHQPYAEDSWTTVRIADHKFRMLGSCRRCHMICIDQSTGERREEPFVTLSRTRRFNGKVFFGAHMAWSPGLGHEERSVPVIKVGDIVRPEV